MNSQNKPIDISQNKEELKNYFECGVCLELFNDSDRFPRVLICGHTFCERCISQIIQARSKFKCPYCNCNIGQLRIGASYKNYSLMKLLALNFIETEQQLSYTIVKDTYSQIVSELDHIPKSITRLVIKRTRDDEQNPFQFDLVRNNRHSMRFFKLLVTFQALEYFQLWVKYSAHGFEECLAESLFELKKLKTVKIVNAYDQYQRMRQIVSLTSNEAIKFEINIEKW